MATFKVNQEEYFLKAYFRGEISCAHGLAQLIADKIETTTGLKANGSNQSEAQYFNFYNEVEEKEYCIRIAAHESRTYNSQPDFEITLGGLNEMTSEVVDFCEYSEDEEFEDEYEYCDEDGDIIMVKFTDTKSVDYFKFDDAQVDAAVAAAVSFYEKHKG